MLAIYIASYTNGFVYFVYNIMYEILNAPLCN